MRTARSQSGLHKKLSAILLGALFMTDILNVSAYTYYDADTGWLNNNQNMLFGGNMSTLGNVGIGTSGPAAKLHVTDGSGGKILVGGALGSGIMFNDANTKISIPAANSLALTTSNLERMRIDNNGNVGIGTTAPSFPLTVKGVASALTAYFSYGDANNTAISIRNVPASNVAMISSEWSSTSNALGFGLGGTEYMRLHTNGNVGIGTTTPGAKLDVNGSALFNGNADFNNAAPRIAVVTGPGTITLGDDDHVSLSNGKLYVKNDGNVGIGTTAPGAALDVYRATSTNIYEDGVRAHRPASFGQYAFMSYGASSADAYFGSVYTGSAGTYGSLHFRQYTQGMTFRDTMNIDSAGNVGIGTTTPAYKLDVVGVFRAGNDGMAVIENRAGGSCPTCGTEAVTLQTTIDAKTTGYDINSYGGQGRHVLALQPDGGYVGIGTTTPSTKLEVAGQIKITGGTPGAGKVLTSDAAGLATWQTPTAASETDPKVGTLTTNYVPKWNGSTLTNANIYDNGTNVGVGTTSPQKVLDVVTPVNDFATVGGAGLGIGQWTGINFGYRENNNNYRKAAIVFERKDEQGSGADGTVHILNDGTNDSSNANLADARLSIRSNGNVGIGVASPGAKLEVAGMGIFGGQTANGVSHYQFDGATYRDPGNFTPSLLVRQDNSTAGAAGFKPALSLYNNDGGLNTTVGLAFVSREAVGAGNAAELGGIMAIKEIAGNAGAWTQGGLNFYTQNSGTRVDAIRILTGGNVGIGTTSPGYKLDVAGSARVQGDLRTTGATGWYNETYGGGWYMSDTSWIRSYGSKNIYHDSGIMRTDGSLQVGSAGGTLDVSNGGNFNYRSGVLFANTAGNVGIGNVAPGYKLDVSGDIRATGDVNAGNEVNFSKLGAWGLQSVNNPEAGYMNPLYAAIAAGKPLYYDEEFAVGNNGVNVYNNSGGGTVAITREADAQAPNRSGYRLTIYNNGGTSSPGLGGFYLSIMSRANATLVQRFRAKIPVGYSVVNAENSQGTNSQVYWLTSQAGTGKWEEYIRIVHSGNTGTFSSGGHVYLTGPAGAVTWYLASANIYEIQSSGNLGITDGQISDVSWSKVTGRPNMTASNFNWNWSGQGGQPTWLWGGSDGTNMYVYNPSNFSVNYASSAGNADTVDSVHASSFIRSDAASDWQIASSNNTANYYHASLEVRELNFGGAQTGAASEAPRIGFHWGGRVASQIGMGTDGVIRTYNNPGTGYEQFAAATITANGDIYATGRFYGAGRPTNGYDINAGGIGSNTVYGYQAICTGNDYGSCDGSNGVVLGRTNTSAKVNIPNTGTTFFNGGSVGIGVNTPRSALHVKSGSSGYGMFTLESTTTGEASMNFRASDGSDASSWTIGKGTGGIGNTFGFYWGGNKLTLDTSGNLTTAASVNSPAFYYTSDRRLKTGIKSIENGLDIIKKLQGVEFKWKKDGVKQVGFIAQDVEKVLPETVKTNAEGYKSVEYGNLVAPVVEAIKELSNKVDELFQKYVDQSKRIDNLEKRLNALENRK